MSWRTTLVIGRAPSSPIDRERDANVGLLLEQMRGKAMPQRVQGYGLLDLGHLRRAMASPVELARRERLHGIASRK